MIFQKINEFLSKSTTGGEKLALLYPFFYSPASYLVQKLSHLDQSRRMRSSLDIFSKLQRAKVPTPNHQQAEGTQNTLHNPPLFTLNSNKMAVYLTFERKTNRYLLGLLSSKKTEIGHIERPSFFLEPMNSTS